MRDTNALVDELIGWLDRGELAKAAERQRLGRELGELEEGLRKGKADLDRLDRIAEAALLLREAPRADVRREVKRLTDTASALRHAQTPDALRAFRQHRWKDVGDAGKALEQQLVLAWRRRCDAIFVDHEALAKMLIGFQVTRSLGKQMATTASKGLALRSRFPDPSMRAELEILVSEVGEQREKLEQAGLTEDVKQLLLAVMRGNATLADLSNQALDWLRKADALRSFRINLRNPQ
ncbi:hypothetical protein WME90_42680 [Sorangium sp. So ce375]|uniref:hypothetical protein n=1 Tax=Sorangium sp. So ce375 TaxID=3133306 RepID=UPI003F5AF709